MEGHLALIVAVMLITVFMTSYPPPYAAKAEQHRKADSEPHDYVAEYVQKASIHIKMASVLRRAKVIDSMKQNRSIR